jgi:hypothetical protein
MEKIRPARVFAPGQYLRITAEDQPGDKFVLLLPGGRALFLTLTLNRLLYSENGTCFAAADETMMTDLTDRTGVGVFSLPEDHWSTPAGIVHDFETSCRIYEMTHTRSESEAHFKSLLDQLATTQGEQFVGSLLAFLSSTFSWGFWEIENTKWKIPKLP